MDSPLKWHEIPGCPGYDACSDGTIWTRWKFKGGGFAGRPTWYLGERRKLIPDRRPENKADMKRHGTAKVGANHPKAKLSDTQIYEILHRRAAGQKLSAIAADYGISDARVSQIFIKGSR